MGKRRPSITAEHFVVVIFSTRNMLSSGLSLELLSMLRLARCLFRIRNLLDLRIEKPLIKMNDLGQQSK